MVKSRHIRQSEDDDPREKPIHQKRYCTYNDPNILNAWGFLVRICLLVDYAFPPNQTGPGIFYGNLSDILIRRGFPIHVLRRRESKHTLFRKLSTILFEIEATLYLIICRDCDVIVAPLWPMPSLTRFALRFLQKKPYLLIIHGSDWMDRMDGSDWMDRKASARKDRMGVERSRVVLLFPFVNLYNKLVLNGAAKILAGYDLLWFYSKNYGIDKKRMLPLTKYRMVNTDQFNPDIKPVALDFCGKKKVLMYYGRLSGDKGVDTLLKSMAIILERVPDARLLIAGSGPLEKNLRAMTSRLGIENEVCFLGFIPHGKIQYYLANAEVVINPLVKGAGLGSTTTECMAMMKPIVIGRANTDIEKVFDEDGCGLTFEPNNHKELAEKILHLLLNLEEKRRYSIKALDYVVKNCGKNTIGERWQSLIQSLTSQEGLSRCEALPDSD